MRSICRLMYETEFYTLEMVQISNNGLLVQDFVLGRMLFNLKKHGLELHAFQTALILNILQSHDPQLWHRRQSKCLYTYHIQACNSGVKRLRRDCVKSIPVRSVVDTFYVLVWLFLFLITTRFTVFKSFTIRVASSIIKQGLQLTVRKKESMKSCSVARATRWDEGTGPLTLGKYGGTKNLSLLSL